MENELSKEYLEYSENVEFNTYLKNLREALNSVSEKFISIGYYLSKLNKYSCFKNMGYKNFDEFCKNEFALDRRTVYRFIQVYDRFGSVDEVSSNPRLKTEYKDFNQSQLIELVSVPEEEFDMYEPDMTVREIRENKRVIELKKKLDSNLDPKNALGSIQLLVKYFLETSFKAGDKQFKTTISNYKQVKEYCWRTRQDEMFQTFDITFKTDDINIPDFVLNVKSPFEYDKEFEMNFTKPKHLWFYNSNITPSMLFENKFDSNVKKELTKSINEKIKEKIDEIKTVNDGLDLKAKKKQAKLDTEEELSYQDFIKFSDRTDIHYDFIPNKYFNDSNIKFLNLLKDLNLIDEKSKCIVFKDNKICVDVGLKLDLYGYGKETRLCFTANYYEDGCHLDLGVPMQNNEVKYVSLNSCNLFFTFLKSMGLGIISKYINASSYIDGTRISRKEDLSSFTKEQENLVSNVIEE